MYHNRPFNDGIINECIINRLRSGMKKISKTPSNPNHSIVLSSCHPKGNPSVQKQRVCKTVTFECPDKILGEIMKVSRSGVCFH